MHLFKRFLAQFYAWACRRLYDELAFCYELVAWLVSLGQWSRWRRLALDHTRGEHVLELGFGTGVLLCQLAAQGYVATGLERSPVMQAITQRRLQRDRLAPTLVQANAQAMPLPANHFATILATFPAPYIMEPATLAECARVLQPGGRLVIVGLWVALQPAWLEQWIPLFYGRPSAEFIGLVGQRLARAGLASQLFTQRCGWAQVGMVVAEKKK
jgi:ubiquinone/menaquinone biosynthesis C-methylase UbiE